MVILMAYKPTYKWGGYFVGGYPIYSQYMEK